MTRAQTATYRKSVCRKIKKIAAEDFAAAMLITLCCSASTVMPPELAKKVFRAWMDNVRKIAGGSFGYIRVVDYGPHPVPAVVFHVIADLPADVCRAACGEWYTGEASASPLDEEGLDRVAASIMRQYSGAPSPKARLWGYARRSDAAHQRQLSGVLPGAAPPDG